MPKRPTLDDVAREAGVSRALVSTALRGRGRVAADTRQRILEACERVGYHPNLNARALATGSSHVVGIVLGDVLNPFFATVADAVARAADEYGLTALLATGQRNANGERHAIGQILSLDPQGVVLIGPTMDQAFITQTLAHVPTVSISRYLQGISGGSIGLDEDQGVHLVVQHLRELGHRFIVHIDGGQGVSAEERRRAFDRWTQHFAVSESSVAPGGFSARDGYQAVSGLIEQACNTVGYVPGLAHGQSETPALEHPAWLRAFPTAIWAGNDRAASGVLVRLHEAGVRVPADVSVMGYDDIAVGSAEQFMLTTIYQPVIDMGRIAVERLIKPGESYADVRLAPKLVVRASTGPASR